MPSFARLHYEMEEAARVCGQSCGVDANLRRSGAKRGSSAARETYDKLLQIVEESAVDPMLAGIPGGKTGLIMRNMKGIGKGKEFRLVEQFQADTRLVKELRGVEEQIARELGQWQERIEVADTSLADIMAKARQRKPVPADESIVGRSGT